MAEAGRDREIELLELYVADQNRVNPDVDQVVKHLLENTDIDKDVRDSVRVALGIAKIKGVILGMKHDDGQEVEVDGKKFQVLLAQGKMAESIIKIHEFPHPWVGPFPSEVEEIQQPDLPDRPADTHGGHEIRP